MRTDGRAATVQELWRYPVKSMQGSPVDSFAVGAGVSWVIGRGP